MVDAENRMLVAALKRKPQNLNFSNKNLSYLPESIGKITSVRCLDLKNNHLTELPDDLSSLAELKLINLGNNKFKEIPHVLREFKCLETLHLFNNELHELCPSTLGEKQSTDLLSVTELESKLFGRNTMHY
uniref:Leucine rich repeat containing protein n=1 Tax=Clytia hemisphaerica TaxID=252671 RepID=A0A7M5X4L8_9CNID